MQQLRDAIAEAEVFAEVLAALHLEGRQLDVDQLASELRFDAGVVEIVEKLAGLGDNGLLIHEFASVCVATINAGSLASMCDVSMFLFARRRERGFEYFYRTENGGGGELTVSTQLLSLIELVVLVDGVLVAEAPSPSPSDDWRDVYLVDATMHITVRSPFYDELQRWYATSITEWRTAHDTE